ncbi:MAG: deoxyribodipyrimidine photo-lyase [Propionicimonas sp.]
MSAPAVLWLRRDLRRADHPALGAAATHGDVLPVFVLDPAFFDTAGPVRQGWLAATLRALDASYEGRLCLRAGDPATVIPELVREVGAASVHVSTETEPGGAARDAAVRATLAAAGVDWVETGSPYAVTPGRVVNQSGEGYKVFTPFLRAWREHGWRARRWNRTASVSWPPTAIPRPGAGWTPRWPRARSPPPRARTPPGPGGRSSSDRGWPATTPTATAPTWPRRPGSRRT